MGLRGVEPLISGANGARGKSGNCLAHNLFGDGVFDASFRLDGKPTGHFL
jgi:hypothetical protein